MKRTQHTRDLIQALVFVGQTIDTIKANRKETLSALAICEIVTGLPIEWFTKEERLLVVAVIRELYGDPTKFISEVMNGYISFVELATNGEKNCDTLCEAMQELHKHEFGSV